MCSNVFKATKHDVVKFVTNVIKVLILLYAAENVVVRTNGNRINIFSMFISVSLSHTHTLTVQLALFLKIVLFKLHYALSHLSDQERYYNYYYHL